MNTSRQTTWPPPPALPDPLAAHDAFLTALVCAPATKPTLSRLWMVQALRKETGLNARQCAAVVNGYCERHSIFPLVSRMKAWLFVMLPLLPIALLIVYLVGKAVFAREVAAAHTTSAMLLILDERIAWAKLFLGAQCLSCVAFIVNSLVDIGRTRREAEEARRRVGSGLGGA